MGKPKKQFDSDENDVVRFIVANVPRSQLVEMYYWCQEPSLLRILRGLAAIPEETRNELAGFFEGRGHEVKVQGIGGTNDFILCRDIPISQKH